MCIDETLVVKVQRPHRLRPRTSLEKEAFFLHQLSAYPDIVVPHVLGYGRHDTIEYLVMTRMPGVSALTVELTGAQTDGRVASAREDPATPPRDSPGAFLWQRALPWEPNSGCVRRACEGDPGTCGSGHW